LLADRLGRAVDVVEREALKPRIRDSILSEAETVF
jgi:predicted nucleotidyltransferase